MYKMYTWMHIIACIYVMKTIDKNINFQIKRAL